MIEYISKPWAWYVAGPLIGVLYLLLNLFGRKFGISSTLRTTCAILGAGKVSTFFNYNWKDDSWNLFFILGSALGAFLSVTFLSSEGGVQVSDSTQLALSKMGIVSQSISLVPLELFSFFNVSLTKVMIWVTGGFLVGFGARYAGGCTSGHAISGLSNLQFISLVAVIGFFIGGLLMTHVFLPEIIDWVL